MGCSEHVWMEDRGLDDKMYLGPCTVCGLSALAEIGQLTHKLVELQKSFSEAGNELLDFNNKFLPQERARAEKAEKERDEAQAERDAARKRVTEFEAELTKERIAESNMEMKYEDACRERKAHARAREALRLQTTRIRQSLTNDLEDGLDTLEIARRVRRERDNLASAWLQVCREGHVPEYEDVSTATPDGIVHGVRQLAAILANEKVLHARTLHKMTCAEKKTELPKSPTEATLTIPHALMTVLDRLAVIVTEPGNGHIRAYESVVQEGIKEIARLRMHLVDVERERFNFKTHLDIALKETDRLKAEVTAAQQTVVGVDRDTRERISLIEGERSRLAARVEELYRDLKDERRDHLFDHNRCFDAERKVDGMSSRICELIKTIRQQVPVRDLKGRYDKALEACRMFVTCWERSHQLEKTDTAVRMARVVIAEAEGR